MGSNLNAERKLLIVLLRGPVTLTTLPDFLSALNLSPTGPSQHSDLAQTFRCEDSADFTPLQKLEPNAILSGRFL